MAKAASLFPINKRQTAATAEAEQTAGKEKEQEAAPKKTSTASFKAKPKRELHPLKKSLPFQIGRNQGTSMGKQLRHLTDQGVTDGATLGQPSSTDERPEWGALPGRRVGGKWSPTPNSPCRCSVL